MSEPVTWTAVGMAAVSSVATWLVILKGKRSNNNSKNPKPGQADICIERGEKIVKIETEQANFKDDIHEIKSSIEEIRRAVVK